MKQQLNILLSEKTIKDWTAVMKMGVQIGGVGPRGRHLPLADSADWHLVSPLFFSIGNPE